MKETTLTLDILEVQMEQLTTEQSKSYLGGNAGGGGGTGTQTPDQGQGPITDYLSAFFGITVTSSQDAAGNWVISIGGGPPIPLTFQLNEVQITSSGKVTDQSGAIFENEWHDWLPAGYGGGSGGGGTGSGGGGGGNGGVSQPVDNNGFYPPEVIAQGQSHTSLADILDLAATALGTAAAHADIAASVMGLEQTTLNAFSGVSTFFVAYDVFSNTITFLQNPNWEDAGQIALALVLTTELVTPVGAVIGGAALVAWELNEYKRAH